MTAISFGIVAALMLLSAVLVVRTKDLVHAVLWLGVMLVATAAFFVIASAPFLATVQILLYVGGVMTLMVFGVMLTRRHDGLTVAAEGRRHLRGAIAALGFFGVMATAILRDDTLGAREASAPDTAALGAVLMDEQLLAFEVLSFLLLAAIIGAAVIARRRDPGATAEKPLVRLGTAARTAEEPAE